MSPTEQFSGLYWQHKIPKFFFPTPKFFDDHFFCSSLFSGHLRPCCNPSLNFLYPQHTFSHSCFLGITPILPPEADRPHHPPLLRHWTGAIQLYLPQRPIDINSTSSNTSQSSHTIPPCTDNIKDRELALCGRLYLTR